MRLLLDANLSPRVAESLRDAGFDAVHVADLGLVTATDDEIFDRAAEGSLVVVTADSDFGALLAMRRTKSPSVVHLRGVTPRAPARSRGAVASVEAVDLPGPVFAIG